MNSQETRESTGNRLGQQTSPYLLQHAGNPVNWQPWDDEALAEARRLNRPILLSVGYSACHWCHVMERESFANPEVAGLMNDHFVCIKVDREERPDLDELYMQATVAMSGHGGWPMNVFLTPDGKPFFAGTYFPPEDSEQRPGFKSLLLNLAGAWKEHGDDLQDQAGKIAERMKRQSKGSGRVLGLEPELLDQSVAELAQRFDREHGGFGKAPKFPAPANLLLLMRYHARSGDGRVLEMVTRTLDGMARGGIYDQLAGGFARYSTDERWLVPHFEKMLYDNAQLAIVYLEGFQATQTPLYRQVAQETLDYVLREMTTPEGGFCSASDADSEGEEGKFFVWTPEQVIEILGDEAGKRFNAYYDVTAAGNWEGKSVLNTPRPLTQVAATQGLSADAFEKELAQSRTTLREARSQRVQPAVDDKVLCSWNGLMIGALAEGYRVLGDTRYLEAARRASDFLKTHLARPDGRLWRTYRNGKAHLNAYLEDYAALAEGLILLYEAAGDEAHFRWACELMDTVLRHFGAEDGGFYETSDDHETLLLRPRAASDGAIPTGQSIAALNLARLAYHLEKPDYRERALATLVAQGRELRAFPAGYTRHLLALDLALSGPIEVVWTGPVDGAEPLSRALAHHYLPNRVVAWLKPGVSSDHPLTRGKEAGAEAAVHLCQGATCAAPVSTPSDLAAALNELKKHVRFELHQRVAGQATPEDTGKLAAARPTAFKELGSTGLKVSRLGFGGYRVDDETVDHEQALLAALDAGVNLIDTSSNYGDGASERLIGAVLRGRKDRRSEVVVVTKAGYVQGSNLEVARARQQVGRPYQEMVPYQEGCWHCLHPEFLHDQIERCSMRLCLQKIDVFLLHNPEYFLMHCEAQGQTNLSSVRAQFDQRLAQAFAFLEHMVKEGRIGCYGISSNTFGSPVDSLTTVSVERCLEIARQVRLSMVQDTPEAAHNGEDHSFKVVQAPLNLLEPAVAPEWCSHAAAAGLGVLVNRPLNAFVQGTLVRLSSFPGEEELTDAQGTLDVMAQVESDYRTQFGQFVQGPGSDQLFRFSDKLRGFAEGVQNLDHWNMVESQRLRPELMNQVGAIDQAMQGPLAEMWVAWRERYMAAFRDVCNDLEQVAWNKSKRLADSVAELVKPRLDEHKDATLSQLAAWVADGVPGVSCVLVGMRKAEYVDDLAAVLDWSPCSASAEVLGALRSWSNPFGVLV